MTTGYHRPRHGELAPHPITPERDGQQACYGQNTEDYFPNGKIAGRRSKMAQAQVDAAKDRCRRCPFVHDCLAYALDRASVWGIWGATTEDERDELRRQRRSA